MKFKIQYADRIVGLLIIIALVSIVFVIFMLGRTQRWFSRDHAYTSYASGALGISRNMAVTCRGIEIGTVKSFDLTEDNRVLVNFSIEDEFNNRVRQGTLVEVQVSPVGLGSRFILYPGQGGQLNDDSFIPMRDSPEGRELIASGLTMIPSYEDPIADILEQVMATFDGVQQVMGALNVSGEEEAATDLGRSIASLRQLTGNLAADMADPNGIRGLLNGDAQALHALDASLVSLSGTLDHVERSTRSLPREMPQIYSLISEARTAVQAAEDVLVSLRNNPLLRRGIPEHAEIDASGTNPRSIQF